MQLFDFRCQVCDHVFEAWDNSDRTANPACPECGHKESKRQISTPRLDYSRMVTDGKHSSDGMTTAIDKWEQGRREKMKIEKRNQENHGTYD